MFVCPHCKKTNSVKAGLRKNKSGFVQKYFCKSCEKYFVRRNGFENMKTKPEIIIDALDLILISVGLLLIASLVEVFITPLLFL